MADETTTDPATGTGSGTEALRAARDLLLELRDDYDEALRSFEWPDVGESFNWAHDWFDTWARGNDRPGLVIVEEDGSRASYSFDELVRRSDQVATWLRHEGVRPGDERHRHARQPGRAVGDDARADQDRRGRHADHHRGRHPPSSSTGSAAAGRCRGLQRRGRREVRRVPGDYVRFVVTPGGRAAGGVARTRGGVRPRARAGPAPGERHRRPAAALLHLRHHQPPKLVEHTQRVLSGRAPVDDVLARRPARRRAPQHLVARAGPSTPGRTSSRPGWPRRRCSSSTTPGSTRRRCSGSSGARGSRRSVRRRRCGGCSSTPTSPAARARCARRSAPASRSTPR